jgi:Flp pilus assembly secretin CpaC
VDRQWSWRFAAVLSIGLLLSCADARKSPGEDKAQKRIQNAESKTTSTNSESKALIQIGVEVVEVDEQKSQDLGINWFSQLAIKEASVPALLQVGTLTRDQISTNLEVMLQEGAADLLANPKLVTRDGTTANFHVGGELPYAVAGAQGTVTIEFKSYGINLEISPHVESSGSIAMTVNAEVSGPDNQNSVTLSGNTVPGIRSRQVNSQLTLTPGTTLTLAGLIQNNKEWTRQGIPGLMHIPLLGYLFSHKAQTVQRTSIVVFVTPTILGLPKEPTVSSDSPVKDDLLTIEERKDMEPSHG